MAKQKKRTDGRYCKNVTIGRNENGSLKRKMVYANTQRELDLKVSELLLQKEKGIIIDDKNMTVDVWADKWLKTYTTNFKDSTISEHRKKINKYIKPYFQGVRLRDLKQYQVQFVLNEIKSPSVPKRFLITLNQILDAAVDNDFISKNVAKGLTAPKFISEPNKPLTDEQVNIIKSTEHELQSICIFLIYSGLRISELINLTWQKVDLKNRKLKIDGDVKTKSSNRVVPIFEPTYNILKQLSDNKVKNIDAYKDYVFLMDCKKLEYSDISRRRVKYNILCNSDFTFHQCRHTFATICYNANIDIKQTQEWLGHANFNTTMSIYTHLSEKNNASATDKIDKYLKTV